MREGRTDEVIAELPVVVTFADILANADFDARTAAPITADADRGDAPVPGDGLPRGFVCFAARSGLPNMGSAVDLFDLQIEHDVAGACSATDADLPADRDRPLETWEHHVLVDAAVAVRSEAPE